MQESVTISRRGNKVALLNNTTRRGIGFSWDYAIDVGQQLQYKARGVRPSESERIGPIVLRRDGDQMVIEDLGGQLLFLLPLAVAMEVGNGLIGKGHELESEAKAEDISYDHALLQRRGWNLGLTDNPIISKMAGIKAAWDTSLRRYIPSSSKLRQSEVGTPTVRREKLHVR